MTQIEKNGVVYTTPDAGKMLRIKGKEELISKAADYKGRLPEYEEMDVNETGSN